jgi:hypothetical protein
MKGDVGRQFYSVDRSRRVGLDVQPQAAGDRNCVSAERFHPLRVLHGSIFGSYASPRIGDSANHGSIGDSRPTPFSGYARGHSVVNETGRRSTLYLSHNLILTLEPESFTHRPTPERCLPWFDRSCCPQATCKFSFLGSSVLLSSTPLK